jgi:hypothetical protein
MSGYDSHIPSGSKPFLSGEPSVLNRMMGQTLNLPTLMASALAAAAQEQEDSLRKAYKKAGHKEIADSVSVTYNVMDSKFEFKASGEGATTLEYGDLGETPNPIVRTTAARSVHKIEKSIQNTMNKSLKV